MKRYYLAVVAVVMALFSYVENSVVAKEPEIPIMIDGIDDYCYIRG